jgi:hypothetical protein
MIRRRARPAATIGSGEPTPTVPKIGYWEDPAFWLGMVR